MATVDKELVKAVLSFCGAKEESVKPEMRPLIPAFALLRYMGRSIVEIHEFAKLQGYEGGYTAFSRWLKRNVDFEVESAKYADEFKAIVAGSKPVTKPDSSATNEGSGKSPSGVDVFAPRTRQAPDQSATGSSEAKPSVSELPTEAEKKPSARDTLEKWKSPSYEDQLEQLGLAKGKHDDLSNR